MGARRASCGQRNKGHVPDIIEIDAVDTLYEVKCWTPIRRSRRQALGHGSTKKGGAVSTNEGSHLKRLRRESNSRGWNPADVEDLIAMNMSSF